MPASAVDDEARRAHTDLSRWDWEFRRLAMDDPRYLERATFESFVDHDPIFAQELQPWPTFCSRRTMETIAEVALGMSDLVRSLPERIFQGDMAALDRYYGFGQPLLTEVLFAPPNEVDRALSRGDFVLSRDGFRCIELNLTANLGGWESPILHEMHLEQPETRTFLDGHDLRVEVTHTPKELFRYLLERTVRPPGEPVNIFLCINEQEGIDRVRRVATSRFTHYYDTVARQLGRPRGKLFFSLLRDVEVGGRGMSFRGEPVHIFLNLLEGDPIGPEVFRCYKAGQVELYNSPAAHILSDKRSIALLSETQESPSYTDREREFLRATLPWTRRVVDGPTTYRGETVSLLDLLTTQRERMVLKPAQEAGGKGVTVGRYSTPASWSESVDRAVRDGSWVVQEYVDSVPLFYQAGEHGYTLHNVVWGPFVFGRRFAGCCIRMEPMAANHGVVSLSQTGTEGVILEVEE